ncbi:seipin-1-like [Bidens hawaiensis]|uniref:seipin-1-like n=1 Tax=Bidens hawaiensis TaxID=980011 RepID=UPI004049B071
MSPPQEHQPISTWLLSLFSVPSTAENGSSSILLKKAAVGLVGVAYMCLALLTLMLLSMVMGLGLVRFLVEEPVHLQERLYFDYREAHPSAVLDFGIEEYDKLGKSVPVGHSCNVRLVFVMPESDYNRDIGMFQVVAESLSMNGDIITSSSRPCMLRFRSHPVRLMQTFVMAVPLFLGITSETQTVNVPLLKYKERYYHRTQFIKISLVPRAGTPFLPQVYEAKLIVSSELPWMKRLIRNWKWTFSVWTSLYTYLMLLLVFVCFFRSMLFPATLTNMSGYLRLGASDETVEGLAEVVVSAGDGRGLDILKQWRQNRGKKRYGEGFPAETTRRSEATSMSVTRDEDVGEDVGDSESVCQ